MNHTIEAQVLGRPKHNLKPKGRKEGVYHLRHFESVEDYFALPMTVDPELF